MFFFWTLFLSILRLPVSQGWIIITAEPGQTVSLPCRAEGDGGIRALKWIRPALGSDYLFVFRNNTPDPDIQHPSYQNRAYLQDSQMKDGDVSLVLKDVTTEDAGTYECRVYQRRLIDYKTIYLIVSHSERIIRVTVGDDVILPCRVPARYKQTYDAVEWIRAGLETDLVFVFRNGKPDPHYQLPSYQNRTDLQDRQMENGDVSLVLKNVTTDDTRTYVCRVGQEEGNHWKREVDPIFLSIVHLEVPPPPSGGAEDGGNQQQGDQDGGNKDGGGKDQGGHPGLAVGLSAAGIIVNIVMVAAAAAVAGVWFYKKKISCPPQSDSGEKDPMSLLADQ